MNLRNPVNNLSYALLHAIEAGLVGVPSAVATDLLGPTPTGPRRRRPMASECHVVMFSQTMRPEEIGLESRRSEAIEVDTVIVFGPECDACVYFTSNLAYHVRHPNRRFFFDVASHSMAAVSVRGAYDCHEHDAALPLDCNMEMELSRLQVAAARGPGGNSEAVASVLRYYADRIERAARACTSA